MSENDTLLAALKKRSKAGPDAVYEISPEQLLPEGRAKYDAHLKQLGVASLRVIVDSNLKPNMPWVNLDGQSNYIRSDGPPFVVISEYNHRWDEAFVNKLAAEGKIYPPLPDLPPLKYGRVMNQFKAMVQVLGLNPAPLVLLTTEENKDGWTSRTKEGVDYILINPNKSEKEQIGTLAHELGHVAKKHFYPAAIAQYHNLQRGGEELAIAQEREADHIAAGVLCQGEAFIESMRKLLKAAEAAAANHTPEYMKSMGNMDKNGKLTGPFHPPYIERIDNMTADMKEAINAGTCPAPGSRPVWER